MYGWMFTDKLKPLVDETFNAVIEEYERDLHQGIGDPNNRPVRVVYWNAMAISEYSRESDKVKVLVENAIEEENRMMKLSEEGLLPTDNEKQRLSKLEA